MRSPTILPVLTALLLCTAGAHTADQSAPRSNPSSGLTELVDFMVVSDDGRPIGDLSAADVTVKVDGRIREIRSLEFVELASLPAGDRPGVLPPPIPDPFGSNRLADDGRIVMIVINNDSIRPGKERPARDAAMRFLGTLSSRDRVGLVTMPRGSVLVDLTRDHEHVRSALSRVVGQAQQTSDRDLPAAGRLPGVSAAEIAASDRACASRLTLNTLRDMMSEMTETDGPKTIVFISSGLMPPTRDAAMTRAPGPCELRPIHYEEVATAAGAARARFYVIQPNDEQADSANTAFADPAASRFATADDNLAGLQHLAGVTRGGIFRLASQHPESVFTRVAYESSAYYVIAFEPDASERNGLAHRVEIRVARDGAVVHSPSTFTIAKADVSGSDLTPQRMLRTWRRFRDLPLRATAYASRMPGGASLKIVAVAEPMNPSIPLKSAAFGLFDAKGKLAAQSSADGNELATLPFLAALPASQGLYLLRVAAVDANGRHGTVDYRFRADLTTTSGQSGLKLSGLALGVSQNGSFAPRLQFGRELSAIALFEIYGTPPRSAEITVRLELAQSDNDPPLVGAPGTVRPGAEDDSRIVIATVPIGSLAPGDYVVRAILHVDGRPVGTVTRTLRKIST